MGTIDENYSTDGPGTHDRNVNGPGTPDVDLDGPGTPDRDWPTSDGEAIDYVLSSISGDRVTESGGSAYIVTSIAA